MLIDTGAISPEQARNHPQRSVVLQALDGQGAAAPSISSWAAHLGDRLLLCSDGLSDVVPDADIARLISGASRDVAAKRLIEAALQAGGQDNVSVVVADVVAADDPSTGWLDALPPPARSRG
jgi:protein phosphatase